MAASMICTATIDEEGVRSEYIYSFYLCQYQHKTQTPIPGTIPDPSPVMLDEETVVDAPFPLFKWIENNSSDLTQRGFKKMFESEKKMQFNIFVVKGRFEF